MSKPACELEIHLACLQVGVTSGTVSGELLARRFLNVAVVDHSILQACLVAPIRITRQCVNRFGNGHSNV